MSKLEFYKYFDLAIWYNNIKIGNRYTLMKLSKKKLF